MSIRKILLEKQFIFFILFKITDLPKQEVDVLSKK